MLKWSVRVVASVLVILCATWVWTAPAFDSIATLLAAISGLLAAFVVPSVLSRNAQVQNLQDSAVGVQAGRDAQVSINK
jgi:hypothetical protein